MSIYNPTPTTIDTDTLATVTARGATTTTESTFSGGILTSTPTNTLSPLPTTALRNNYTGCLGYRFTVAAEVYIQKVGRLFTTDANNKIINLYAGTTKVATWTILVASTSDANGYKYVDIAPFPLTPGVTYTVTEDTVSGGDFVKDTWFPTTTSNYTITTGAYGSPSTYPASNFGGAGSAYSTINFYATDKSTIKATGVSTPAAIIDSLRASTISAITDSTTAITLNNVAGTAIATIDTTNSRLGIGVTPTYTLDVSAGNNIYVGRLSGTSSSSRLIINNTSGSPNAGINLQENSTGKWTLASYSGGTFTFYNDALSAEAISIASGTNAIGLKGDTSVTGTFSNSSRAAFNNSGLLTYVGINNNFTTDVITTNNFAIQNKITWNTSTNDASRACIGTYNIADKQGTGNVLDVRGLQNQAGNSGAGNVTYATAQTVYVPNNGAGTIANGTGLWVYSPTNSGPITTMYGVRLDDLKNASVTTAWGLYQVGTSTNNYFEGQTGFGTATLGSVRLRVQATTSDSSSYPFYVQNSGGTVLMAVRADGLVGIGTNGPTTRLDVTCAGSAQFNVKSTDSDAYITLVAIDGTTNKAFLYQRNGTGALAGFTAINGFSIDKYGGSNSIAQFNNDGSGAIGGTITNHSTFAGAHIKFGTTASPSVTAIVNMGFGGRVPTTYPVEINGAGGILIDAIGTSANAYFRFQDTAAAGSSYIGQRSGVGFFQTGTGNFRMEKSGGSLGNMDMDSLACGQITISDAKNIILDATTGTKIGTATSQKLGFWNATPIVQPTTAGAAATFVTNTSLIANDTATFDGYTIGQVVKALRNAGLLA